MLHMPSIRLNDGIIVYMLDGNVLLFLFSHPALSPFRRTPHLSFQVTTSPFRRTVVSPQALLHLRMLTSVLMLLVAASPASLGGTVREFC